MVKLTPAEWKKPNSSTGEARIDILRRVMFEGIPIGTVFNTEVVVKNSVKNLMAISGFERFGGTFSLETDKGVILSSNIGKSHIFGGGKGSGGGTENTAAAESQQCLWLAAMLANGLDKDIDYYTPPVLKGAMPKIDVGNTTFEKMMNLDPSWSMSAYLTAQYIIKNNFVNKSMVFHRDSARMKKIYAAKKVAFKNSGFTNVKDDKWNPADIWAIEPNVDLDAELDTSSIEALNQSLIRLFNDKKVIGISLKVVKKKAKHQILNLEKTQGAHSLVSASLSSNRGTFYSTKGGYIVFDAGKMEIRPNNFMGTNKIEIMGKTARGGGIGWKIIVEYAKRYINYTIPDNSTLKNMAYNIHRGNTAFSDKDLEKFYDISKWDLPKSIDLDTFKAEVSAMGPDWVMAKLAAAYVTHSLVSSEKNGANEFVNAMVNYAGSKMNESSVYIKVYE
jgi:hypothetical protein